MNDWPPPSVADAPAVPPTAAVADRWWKRPAAQGLLVAWVVGGLVVLVAIGVTAAQGENPKAVGSIPTATAAPVTTTGPDVVDAATTPTTEAQVRSAPPVPPAPVSTTPPTSVNPPATTVTTIVVTLPPTTTVAVTLPAATEPTIDIAMRFDADGDDEANLNDEWVRFTNSGGRALDLTNWIVRDDGLTHAHVFEALTLEPGAAVTLYSGCGEPTGTERFFCASGAEIWNNDGDVVSLFDDTGVLVSQRRG